MDLSDWAKCPSAECDSLGPVQVSTVDHGEGHVFVSFRCLNCDYGSLEDDLRWWIRCPHCMEEDVRVTDEVSAHVTAKGKVRFNCNSCGEAIEKYPETKWDSS